MELEDWINHKLIDRGVHFDHPDTKMLHNQIGAFFLVQILRPLEKKGILEVNSESASIIDAIIDQACDKFIEILKTERGF